MKKSKLNVVALVISLLPFITLKFVACGADQQISVKKSI